MDDKSPKLTILRSGESMFKDKGSKHLGFVFEVKNVNEVQQILDDLKKIHPKANHHCFAYQIENTPYPLTRYSDDGEPSGSAGLPIFNQLAKYNLTNTLAIVIRYFGGTKLGVGGLMNAYKTATESAIQNAQTTQLKSTIQLKLSCVNEYISSVLQIISVNQFKVITQDYTQKFNIVIEVEEHAINQVKATFSSLGKAIKIDVLLNEV